MNKWHEFLIRATILTTQEKDIGHLWDLADRLVSNFKCQIDQCHTCDGCPMFQRRPGEPGYRGETVCLYHELQETIERITLP